MENCGLVDLHASGVLLILCFAA